MTQALSRVVLDFIKSRVVLDLTQAFMCCPRLNQALLHVVLDLTQASAPAPGTGGRRQMQGQGDDKHTIDSDDEVGVHLRYT